MASPRDEIIGEIAKRLRNDGYDRGQDFPSSSEPPKDVNEGIGGDKERAGCSCDGHAIG